MLSVVCWKWGSKYGPEYVNRLASSLAKYLSVPHKLYCITDDSVGIRSGVEIVPMPDFHGLGRARKLWVFSQEASKVFGSRMMLLDLDCFVTSSLDAIAERSEPLVLWRCVPKMKYSYAAKGFVSNEDGATGSYNTSIILTSAGVLPDLWRIYLADPKGEEDKARRASFGTVLCTERTINTAGVERRTVEASFLAAGDDDQMIVSMYAKSPALFSEADGVYKWGRRGFEDKAKLPDNARLVFFNGSIGANMRDLAKYDWVKAYCP